MISLFSVHTGPLLGMVGLCWIYVGSKMATWWVYVGSILDLCWVFVVPMLSLCWVQYVRSILGLYRVYIKIIPGQCSDLTHFCGLQTLFLQRHKPSWHFGLEWYLQAAWEVQSTFSQKFFLGSFLSTFLQRWLAPQSSLYLQLIGSQELLIQASESPQSSWPLQSTG